MVALDDPESRFYALKFPLPSFAHSSFATVRCTDLTGCNTAILEATQKQISQNETQEYGSAHRPARAPVKPDYRRWNFEFPKCHSCHGARKNKTSGPSQGTADEVVKGIKRKPRKQYSAEEKITTDDIGCNTKDLTKEARRNWHLADGQGGLTRRPGGSAALIASLPY